MTEQAKIVAEGAAALGVRRGDRLLVHSSLRSLGGGFSPDDVIRGLLEALGEEGTLMFPALSYESCNAGHPVFDVLRTPSNVGVIPEKFRTYMLSTPTYGSTKYSSPPAAQATA